MLASKALRFKGKTTGSLDFGQTQPDCNRQPVSGPLNRNTLANHPPFLLYHRMTTVQPKYQTSVPRHPPPCLRRHSFRYTNERFPWIDFFEVVQLQNCGNRPINGAAQAESKEPKEADVRTSKYDMRRMRVVIFLVRYHHDATLSCEVRCLSLVSREPSGVSRTPKGE